MPSYTLKPGPGLDLSTVVGWQRTTTKATTTPSRPAAPTWPAPKPGEVLFCEIDPDGAPDRAVRVAAEAAAHNAAKELGLAKTPRIRWYEKASPELAAYRAAYWKGASFRTWSGHPDEVGSAGPGHVGDEIWLRADLSISEAIVTARHEAFHRFEFVTDTEYGEVCAEAFAHGTLEIEAA
jgi:hypothetical protein